MRRSTGPKKILTAYVKIIIRICVVCFFIFSQEKMLYKLSLISPYMHRCGIVCKASRRHFSQELKTIKNLDPALLRRGTGGRLSFNGNVVTVFGATGFLGIYLCTRLAKQGAQIIIPYRCDIDDYSLKRLKLCGDLGQILFQPFDLRDPLSIRKAMKYSNAVVNLIGKDIETKNFNYYQVHERGAREIAKACRELNIERLIHFSSLNVTETPKRHYLKKIDFLPSKLKGEIAVHEEFPTATIFRPSNIIGFVDRFLWPLFTRRRKTVQAIPLYARGEKTIKQPVYAGDVAQGVINAINDYNTRGKIYQAVGPQRFYLKDIAEFGSKILQKQWKEKVYILDINYDLYFLAKVLWYRYVLEVFLSEPARSMALEYIERESITDVLDPDLPTLADLGVTLSRFEDIAPILIFKTFKAFPSASREYHDVLPVESLSLKAVSNYSLKTAN